MQNLRQPPKYDKGIGRFRGEASLSSREVYINTSRLENGGRKSLYKSRKSVGFQPLIVSFSVFAEFETFLFKFQTFSVSPNVTSHFHILHLTFPPRYGILNA